VLHALRARFYGAPLVQDHRDVHDGVLSLLLLLAGDTLASELGGTEAILALLYGAQQAAAQRLPMGSFARVYDNPAAAEEEEEEEEEEEGSWGGGSGELSEWSDEEQAPGSPAQAQQHESKKRSAERMQQQILTPISRQLPRGGRRGEGGGEEAPAAPRPPPLPPAIHELRPQLAELRPGDSLFQVSHQRGDFLQLPGSCYSAHFVAGEALALLQGAPCHLAAAGQAGAALALDPCACTPGVSRSALQRALQPYAAAGTCALHVAAVCAAIRTASAAEGGGASARVPLLGAGPAGQQAPAAQLLATPVLRAFAAAAAQQLDNVRAFGSSLQRQLASGDAACSLLQLRRRCTGALAALQHLSATCDAVVRRLAAQPACTEADTSAAVLDSLLAQLVLADRHPGSEAGARRAALLHLLLAAAVPYLDALEVWLYQGHTSSLPGDFYMRSNTTARLQVRARGQDTPPPPPWPCLSPSPPPPQRPSAPAPQRPSLNRRRPSQRGR
jgi:hypothetical protein